jgi:photosystem II stability/assembly factor-like uncharacterized protein
MFRIALCCLSCCLPSTLFAQWSLLNSPSKANLRSVHATDEAVWISGDQGTILRSTDNGTSWTTCAIPKGAEHASFRSVQAIDADTAIVMSTGKGDQSRLYRTGDSCKTWKEVFVNPYETSSFESLRRVTSKQIYLLAEPAEGKFQLYLSPDGGNQWFVTDDPGLDAVKGESSSGSTLFAQGAFLFFGTGGDATPALHYTRAQCTGTSTINCPVGWIKADLASLSPVAGTTITAVTVQMQASANKVRNSFVAVGGIPTAKGDGTPFAAVAIDGEHWQAVQPQLRGFRTAVAIDGATQTTIAIGPNGTDLSNDYGKTWQSPKPGVGAEGTGWTALSLPFAVGMNGQIGMLLSESLKR